MHAFTQILSLINYPFCFVGTMMDTGKRAASNNRSSTTGIKGWICNLYGYSKD